MAISLGLIGVAAYLILAAAPDIKRYMRMRAM